MSNYLHGVETINLPSSVSTVNQINAAVVAIIGIAPVGPKQAITLCLNEKDDAQFGAQLVGFNIPRTLGILRKEAGGFPVLVINVFEDVAHTTPITDESKTITNGKLKLDFNPVGAVTIKDNAGNPSTLQLNTDYTLDAFGNFVALSAAAANGTALRFTYRRLNASAITASNIVGAVSGAGLRTGLELLDECFSRFGYNPKIIIAPEFSTLSGVFTAMRAKALKLRARFLQDAPAGITVQAAITGRGVGGTIGFNTADERTKLCYPMLKTYHPSTEAEENYPMSAFAAGVWVSTVISNGYWFSPSNKPLKSATSAERVITSNVNDASTEANSLNAAGITTYFNDFGTGLKLWGNRNASFPSQSTPRTFDSFVFVDDIVTESLERFAANMLDMPVTQAWIDSVRESGNNFINSLIKRGALLPGSRIEYNRASNPPAQIANGQVVFTKVYMAPVPAERITIENIIDINLLQKLN